MHDTRLHTPPMGLSMLPRFLWHHPLSSDCFKPDLCSQSKTLSIWSSCLYPQGQGAVTQQRVGVWKGEVSYEEFCRVRKRPITSERAQLALLEKAGRLPKPEDILASLPDPGPNNCISATVLEKRRKENWGMIVVLLRSPEHAHHSRNLCKWKL